MDRQELHSEKFYEPIQFRSPEGTYFWNWISTTVTSELYQTKSLRSVLVELIQIWFTVWYQTHPPKVSLNYCIQIWNQLNSSSDSLCKILLCRKYRKFRKLQPWRPFKPWHTRHSGCLLKCMWSHKVNPTSILVHILTVYQARLVKQFQRSGANVPFVYPNSLHKTRCVSYTSNKKSFSLAQPTRGPSERHISRTKLSICLALQATQHPKHDVTVTSNKSFCLGASLNTTSHTPSSWSVYWCKQSCSVLPCPPAWLSPPPLSICMRQHSWRGWSMSHPTHETLVLPHW